MKYEYKDCSIKYDIFDIFAKTVKSNTELFPANHIECIRASKLLSIQLFL